MITKNHPPLDGNTTVPPYLSTAQVADLLGLNPVTLRQWRRRKHGPAYVKLEGGQVRYPWASLRWYLESRTVDAHALEDGVRAGQSMVASEQSAAPEDAVILDPPASLAKRR